MPYIFTKTKDPNNPYSITKVSVETDAITLPALLDSFEDFLRGCGFSLKLGSLQVVDEDEIENTLAEGYKAAGDEE